MHEQLFNEWETKFCNEIFNPFCYGGALPSISYGDWLIKFCVSVSWRSLLFIRETGPFSHFNAKQIDLTENALGAWRHVLLGKLKHPGKFEQHLIPFEPVHSIKNIQFPPNINRYLLRMIEIDAGANGSTAFVFSKLGRLGLLGFIELENSEQWVGTRVRLRGGRILPRKYVLPIQFGDYLASRAQRVWDAQARMSSVQRETVADTFRKNIDRFANSQLREAMEYDLSLFGDAAFTKDGGSD